MGQVYLINLATFSQYEDISINVKPERMLGFVKKAQELDLKLFLGQALYFDFLSQFEDSAAGAVSAFKSGATPPYRDLYEGVTYEDLRGHTIIYDGIIPAMIYFTFARFIQADAIRFTASGPVKKAFDNSEALSYSETMKVVQDYRSIANAHCNEVEKFLYDNRKDYPLWRFSEKTKNLRQAGPRIRGIDHTNFNFPGYGNRGFGTNDYNDLL